MVPEGRAVHPIAIPDDTFVPEEALDCADAEIAVHVAAAAYGSLLRLDLTGAATQGSFLRT